MWEPELGFVTLDSPLAEALIGSQHSSTKLKACLKHGLLLHVLAHHQKKLTTSNNADSRKNKTSLGSRGFSAARIQQMLWAMEWTWDFELTSPKLYNDFSSRC